MMVSVIIPTYNRVNVIERAINSVLTQSYDNYEIIVVDDNSVDGTSEMILSKYKKIKLITLECNQGPAEARNVGIKSASGDIVAFLDSDDEWENDYIKEQVSCMVKSDAVLVYCNFTKIHYDGKYEMVNTSSCCADKDSMVEEFLMRNPIRTMSIVVSKRDAVIRSGLFDKNITITEDRDFYLRMLSEGIFVHTPINLVKRYMSNDGLTRDYRLWGKHLLVTLNKFFSDSKNISYKKLKNVSLVNASFQVSQFSYGQRDYLLSLKYLIFALKYSLTEYRLLSSFFKKIIFFLYHNFIANEIKIFIKQLYIDTIMKFEVPTVIVFFVTTKCNARCGHCFFWKKVNTNSDELSVDEIRNILNSLKNKTTISLTGGDPFLRKDFFEICSVIAKNRNIESITINTNGIKSDFIYDTCKKILDETSVGNLVVIVSLDGLSVTHDKIRGVTGSFDSAVKTLKNLNELKKKYKSFNVQVLTVLMRDNLYEITYLMNFVNKFNIEHKFSFMRGAYSTFCLNKSISSELNPDDELMMVLSTDEMKSVLNTIITVNRNGGNLLLSKRQIDKLNLSIDIVKSRKRIIPCYAGRISAVIYSNGDISFCEQVVPVGNIRDAGYDLNKMWTSKKAHEMRKKIIKCECIHGCNLSTSLSIHPQSI